MKSKKQETPVKNRRLDRYVYIVKIEVCMIRVTTSLCCFVFEEVQQ